MHCVILQHLHWRTSLFCRFWCYCSGVWTVTTAWCCVLDGQARIILSSHSWPQNGTSDGSLANHAWRSQLWVALPYLTGNACYHLALRSPMGPMRIPELTF